ncbi:MAG: hypothetical protein A2Y74_09700 [Actinobacteria bacterium RBG_13_63_9]|nr:MAG: hypothetical protein A2Y74_09700 [Actinobacteria bacterium RBG_13_63_9]
MPVAVELPITLGQFVKLAGLAATGGEAKQLVTTGLVLVNGRIEARRGHKLGQSDVVESRGAAAQVVKHHEGPPPGRSGEERQKPAVQRGLHQRGSVPDARPPIDS